MDDGCWMMDDGCRMMDDDTRQGRGWPQREVKEVTIQDSYAFTIQPGFLHFLEQGSGGRLLRQSVNPSIRQSVML